jgi:plastocyanin
MVRFARVLMFTAAYAVVAAPLQAALPVANANWPGEEMPLPLAVRTPQDLVVKALAERQYLIFNLLAGAKQAYDVGNFALAASKWESLLRLPGLDPEIDRAIRPLAIDARARAGGSASGAGVALPPVSTAPAGSSDMGAAMPAPTVAGVSVSGTVSGGGKLGPGGTVLWMKRVGGLTPRPAAARGKMVRQKNKTFWPRVLAVPVGSKVEFKNEDEIFHNVFSLSRPNDFDTGLYRQGASYTQTFRKTGVVQILCNIHSSMIAYVFVVDSPYYAQADAGGAFTIKNVPPGDYEIETWHESTSRPWKQKLTIGADGLRGLSVTVAGDKSAPAFIPDKSGKPRQAHLGY